MERYFEMKDKVYWFFELIILELHDRGELTLDLLDILAKAYPSWDIDEFCAVRKRARDGKDLPDIAIALVDPAWHLEKPDTSQIRDGFVKHELEHKYKWARHEKWREITEKRWGWHQG